jgi:hypothetical protein
MNAVIKQKPAPRTASQLSQQVADDERRLLEARRLNSTARNALPTHLASGDEEAIAQCRREIAGSGVRIKELIEAIDSGKEAIQVARERERAAANAQTLRELERSTADARKQVEVLGDTIKAFAIAYKATHAALESLESQMRQAGVTPDPYVLRAKLEGLVDLALHLESGGLLGEQRTLDSPDQLRASGRASLRHAAQEFHTLTMQRLRSALRTE